MKKILNVSFYFLTLFVMYFLLKQVNYLREENLSLKDRISLIEVSEKSKPDKDEYSSKMEKIKDYCYESNRYVFDNLLKEINELKKTYSLIYPNLKNLNNEVVSQKETNLNVSKEIIALKNNKTKKVIVLSKSKEINNEEIVNIRDNISKLENQIEKLNESSNKDIHLSKINELKIKVLELEKELRKQRSPASVSKKVVEKKVPIDKFH